MGGGVIDIAVDVAGVVDVVGIAVDSDMCCVNLNSGSVVDVVGRVGVVGGVAMIDDVVGVVVVVVDMLLLLLLVLL